MYIFVATTEKNNDFEIHLSFFNDFQDLYLLKTTFTDKILPFRCKEDINTNMNFYFLEHKTATKIILPLMYMFCVYEKMPQLSLHTTYYFSNLRMC